MISLNAHFLVEIHTLEIEIIDSMRKSKAKNTVQVSITMERELKQRYAKLALEMDLSLSQLIRLALRKLEESRRE